MSDITHIMAEHGIIPAEAADTITATRATAGHFGHPADGGLIERIARAWACMEGKGARFDACKADPEQDRTEGYHSGYMAEAEELAKRAGLMPTVAAIRALPAAQPAQRVKALVWEASYGKYDGGKEHFGTGIFGHWYGVKREKTSSWRVSHHVGAKPVEIGYFPDLDAAKAAAQSDYKARILSALAPAAQVGAEVELVTDADELRAERDALKAENERWRSNSIDTWEAMQAMRNAINEHCPMPSIESGLLQGPENSIFCATVAEAVIGASERKDAEIARLREALIGLECACEQLAATRIHEVYLAMIDSGQSDALISLDARRQSARAALRAEQGQVR